MKKIVSLFLFLTSCSHFPLEQELKDLTSMIQVTYICVEKTDNPIAARWDESSDCLQLNIKGMQAISEKYGKNAAKSVWLHELALLKNREKMTRKEQELAADIFVGCQIRKHNLNPDEYYDYLIHEYVPNKHQGKLMKRVVATQRGYKNCR